MLVCSYFWTEYGRCAAPYLAGRLPDGLIMQLCWHHMTSMCVGPKGIFVLNIMWPSVATRCMTSIKRKLMAACPFYPTVCAPILIHHVVLLLMIY